MFHYETDRIAAAATAKALVNFLGWGNGKRRRFFIVKRAQADIINSTPFKLYKGINDLYDINPANYLLYCFLGDHCRLKLEEIPVFIKLPVMKRSQ
jgi:hypothetical protein